MVNLEQFQQMAEEVILKRAFEFPVHWVMIGVNGVFIIGEWATADLGADLKTIVLSGEPRKLEFPVTITFVDRTGRAAHFSFEKPDGPVLTHQTGQA